LEKGSNPFGFIFTLFDPCFLKRSKLLTYNTYRRMNLWGESCMSGGGVGFRLGMAYGAKIRVQTPFR
jgi:hypothetical protein